MYEIVDLGAHSNVTGALPCSMSAPTEHLLRSDGAVLSRGSGHLAAATDRCNFRFERASLSHWIGVQGKSGVIKFS